MATCRLTFQYKICTSSKKYFFSFFIVSFCYIAAADAQIGIFMGPRMGFGPSYGYPHEPRRHQNQNLPPFKPTLNLSFGYGFPNLDVNELPIFTKLYRGSVSSQMGPVTGTIDYRFARLNEPRNNGGPR